MEAIFWIINWEDENLARRAGVKGSIRGLEGQGLFVDPQDEYIIVKCLVQNKGVRKILIAYHPPEEKSTTNIMPGDVVLPEIADEKKKEILAALRRERPEGWKEVSDLLNRGETAVKAKCLRQERKSKRLSSSYLFNRLAEIAATNYAGGSLQAPIETLAREFEVERDPLFVAWQRIASRLCALDLDLCALDLLLTKDLEIGSERAAEYLREMLDGQSSLWLASLSRSLKPEVEKIAEDWGEIELPDLGPIQKVLDALVAVAAASPTGASTEDAEGLIRLVQGPLGFGQALWKLSQYFSRLAH